MIPLHHDPHYTFRFGDDRIIPRFHLDGVEAGRRVDVFRIDPATGGRLELLTTGVAGDAGWLDVKEPIVVRAGGAFVAVPDGDGPPRAQFPTCNFQGISAGWADIYHRGLDCQWIDITGVPSGRYVLEVHVNPARVIHEGNYQNNVGRAEVVVP